MVVRARLNGEQPRCDHVDSLAEPRPAMRRCAECVTLGLPWTHLLACLTCGWVACSDDSPGKHAKAHYEESDHPVFSKLDGGTRWRWCYVHRRLV